MARLSEFDTIMRYFAPLSARAPGAFGLANDAAVWRPSDGFEAVVTTDCMVAGVHFLADDPPASIAAKLLAVNLSDIAAMGARPAVYTVAAAWPKATEEAWIAAFAAGLGDAQADAGVVLIGGDTVSTPGPMTFTLTAIGEVKTGGALSRGGSAAGDVVFVSGTIGDAALGLKVLRGTLVLNEGADADFLIGRYRGPTARSGLGAGLVGLASAAIDVSDGLAQDLGHMARESGVEFTVRASDLPLSGAARAVVAADRDFWDSVFGGGDDYELAFTVPRENVQAVWALAASVDTPITEIGDVGTASAEGISVRFLDDGGSPIAVSHGGYQHF